MQLDLPDLEPGETATISVPDGIEAALVLLAGDVAFDGRPAHRDDVFDQPATAMYLPPGSSIDVSAHTRGRARARRDGRRRAARAARRGAGARDPGRCRGPRRGRPGWQRQVHDVIADTVPAQRLLVGETFNGAGEWSSFPPHKHDGGNGEPALEEVYYYRFDRPDGFGFQGLYEHPGAEHAVFLRHGAVVGIPRGYHPVCAAPGYRLYYLWALGPKAGTARGLALHEDPAHRWLHDRDA